MDAGAGRFVSGNSEEELRERFAKEFPERANAYVFRVGDHVEIHGSRFKILAIGSKFMKLRLLPADYDNS